MAFIQSVILPKVGCAYASTALCTQKAVQPTSPQRFVIEAAKHARLKVTKEHERRRPRKHRPSDIHRKPPPYNPEPERAEGLPPVYTIISSGEVDDEVKAGESGSSEKGEGGSNSVEDKQIQDVVIAGAAEDIAEEEMATSIGEDSSLESAEKTGSDSQESTAEPASSIVGSADNS